MKDFNLEKIPHLSDEARQELETQNRLLTKNAGATIKVDKVDKEILQLSVKNVNGKRTSKYDLFDYTYKLFAKHLPEEYRLVIKV